MSNDSDDEIRAAFRELRNRHQPPPPPTDSIVREVGRQRHRRRLTVVAVAAAAIGAFIVPIVVVTSIGGGSDQVAGQDNPSICQDVFFTSGEGSRYEGAYAVYGFDEHGARNEQLTNDHASQEAALSPDGNRMVVVSGRGHRFDPEQGFAVSSLYVSDLDGGNERRLTAGHVDELPAWSPDGTQIAFIRRLDRAEQILVVDAAGPAEPTVVKTFGPRRSAPSYLAWLDDDTVAWWGESWRGGPAPLYSRDASGSGPTSTVAPDVLDPVLSADRTEVAYVARVEGSADLQQIAVRDLGTGQVTIVGDSASHFSTPVAWTRDDRLFFTRNVEGPGVNLVIADDGGKGATEVVGQPEWEGYEVVHLNPVCG